MSSIISGTPRTRRIGVLAIIAVWFTAAVSVPLSKIILGRISAEELLILRSVFCIATALAITHGRAWKSHPTVILAGLIIGIGSITFYRAIALLGVDPVVCLMTFIPVFNVLIVMWEGKRPTSTVIIGILAVIGGTAWALEPWHRSLDPDGLRFAMVCVVVSAIGFDLWGKAPESSTVSEKCFWLSAWVLALSLVIIKWVTLESHPEAYSDPGLVKMTIGACAIVTVYIFCSIVPYSAVGRMNIETASVLSQAGGPFVILFAYLIAHERWAFHQCLGVGCALAGAAFVSFETVRAQPKAAIVVPQSQPTRSG